jgi:hypothetical protein
MRILAFKEAGVDFDVSWQIEGCEVAVKLLAANVTVWTQFALKVV